MTKVTVEMLERVETLAAFYAKQRDGDGDPFPALQANAADLRALTTLCRRVIEPGEAVVERCAREFADRLGFGWDTLNEDWENDAADPILTRKDFRDSARAVLASLTREGE